MNINQNQWVRRLFLGTFFASVRFVTSPVLAQQEQEQHQQESPAGAARRLFQQAGGKVDARHVAGPENIKRNRSGSRVVLNDEPQCKADTINAAFGTERRTVCPR